MKQRVWIDLDDDTLAGDLFVPGGPGPHPAVVVAGPMTSVKEQVAGVYACALAVRGIAALAIDHRHYGESTGEPRQWEHPEHKVADLRAAFTWLGAQPAIDPARRGLVGVCLGAGYACAAAVGLPDARAIATVVGYFPDPHQMRAENADFAVEVASGAAARAHYEATGEVQTVPAAAHGHGAPMQADSVVDYYATRRAAVPNYRNEFAVMSRETWLEFDAHAAAPHVRAPMLFVHAEHALAPHWARRFHDALTTERTWVDAAPGHQADFYDDPDRVAPAADTVAAWLGPRLAPGAAG